MMALLALLQRAFAASEPLDRGADLKLALAITQLLIDSGRADAAGCVVVATWRTRTQVRYEVICAERIRIRSPVCSRAFSRGPSAARRTAGS
jgi:hypothetical protein